MQLPPETFRELQSLLESAYTNATDLFILSRSYLGHDLELITSADPGIRAIVYRMIKWAETENRIDDLLEAMRQDRSTNQRIAEFVNNFRPAPPPSDSLQPRPSDEDRYLTEIIQQCDEHLRTHHPWRLLRDVYVAPELTVDFILPEDDSPSNRLGPARLPVDALLDRSPRARYQSDFFHFEALLARLLDRGESTRHVITGDPGIGKTTLLNYVALCCADERKGIPVFVALPDYADQLRQNNLQLTMPAYLATKHRDLTAFFPNLSEDTVKERLRTGEFLLLLDALDEIGSPQLRSRVIDNIRALFAYDPRLIVTSRSSSYDNELARCTVHELLPLNDEQITKFVANYFGSADHPWSIQLLHEIQNNKRLSRLMSNPLLLALMIATLQNKQAPQASGYIIPDRRAALYEEFFNELIERRFKARQRNPDLVPLLLKKDIQKAYLYAIGHTLHERQLWYALGHIVLTAMRQVNNQAGTSDLENDLTFLVDEVHIIQKEQVRDTYSFSHLAFQEFTTARYLIEQPDQNSVMEQLLESSMDPWWHEVIVIYCSREDNPDFLQRLMQVSDNIFCTRGLLMADCVTASGDDTIRDNLHDRLAELYRETPFTRLRNELFRAIVQLRSDRVEGFLAAELDEIDISRNMQAIEALGHLATPRAVEQLVGLINSRRSLNQELIYAIIDALIDYMPDEARRLVVDQLYGNFPRDVIRRLTYITRPASHRLLIDLAQDETIDSDLRDLILVQCGQSKDSSVIELYRRRMETLEERRDLARLTTLLKAIAFPGGEQFAPLALTLLNGKPMEMQAAASFLGRYKVIDVKDRMVELLLGVDDEHTQIALVEALLQFGDPDAEEWVLAYLDEQPAPHQRTIDVLGRYGREKSMAFLTERCMRWSLLSLPPEMTTSLFVALHNLSKECKRPLPAGLARRIASYLLDERSVAAPALAPYLIETRAELGGHQLAGLTELPWFREALIHYLLEQPIPHDITALVTSVADQLIDGDSDDVNLVLDALRLHLKLYGRMVAQQQDLLEKSLRHRHEPVCCAAMEAARLSTHLDPERFSSTIIELLAHQSPAVVVQAIETLGRLDDDRAVPPLLQFLDNPTFRDHAYNALYELSRRNGLLGRDQLRAKRESYDVLR